MVGNEVVHRHLKLARVELIRQRDELDQEIDDLDAMLARYAPADTRDDVGTPPVATTPQPRTVSRSNSNEGSLNMAIQEFVNRVGREVTTREVVTVLEGPGRKPASIRSALPKLADAGLIDRPRRGMYGPTKTPGDTAVTVPPGSVPTERPGGDGHAAGPDSVSDHREAFGGRNTGDQHRETATPVAVQF